MYLLLMGTKTLFQSAKHILGELIRHEHEFIRVEWAIKVAFGNVLLRRAHSPLLDAVARQRLQRIVGGAVPQQREALEIVDANDGVGQ